MENNSGKLTERIKIRLTKEQRNCLVIRATKADTSMSAYMRSRLQREVKIAPTTHLDLVPELRNSGVRLRRVFDALRQSGMNPELKREHENALSELTKILNQIGTADRQR